MITGANKNEYHVKGVNIERDMKVKEYVDIIMVRDGDSCPQCESGTLKINKAIELGHLFKLGTKYSQSMKCLFTDSDGTEKPIVMGSYGIGIERIMASIIDKHHDKDGIIWPIIIAPFLIHIIPLDMSNKDVRETSEKIYNEIIKENIELIIDDRDVRPGYKFKDADLIGIPVHIIVGERSLKDGFCEVKLRREEKKHKVSPKEVIPFVKDLISQEEKKYET